MARGIQLPDLPAPNITTLPNTVSGKQLNLDLVTLLARRTAAHKLPEDKGPYAHPWQVLGPFYPGGSPVPSSDVATSCPDDPSSWCLGKLMGACSS